ncbi:helix-turn-helix domain-containing protein [Xanthomonas cucurbitae]|uniref:Helix-turn-helix domain-containing protein n=1 Tax=Xanthomonas cucurbitae TaxID=56453 RepID=A0ABY7YBU6_9XANT|nr:helix-turn-helix domain-containing protein [Xanthomonas cucurbitae]WDM67468.1 helix-turn-helix domain-containing protein [Xanthomonas cucurbitae]WDM71344.1 helix-turn-helix domain-containing protein [Xanthomonas cucurbitae]WDM75676.1 helix-turn-helix domain-containing protein [Xanthomonas cucurbitae]
MHARLLTHVERHLHDPARGMTSLQTDFGLSRATLYRIFQQLGGLHGYIRDRRLDAAHAHLVSAPDCSLTWLLYELGFNSERQFQRAFLARFGMAPSEWKRQCQSSARLAPQRRRLQWGPRAVGQCNHSPANPAAPGPGTPPAKDRTGSDGSTGYCSAPYARRHADGQHAQDLACSAFDPAYGSPLPPTSSALS